MYLKNILKNIIRYYHNYLSPFMLCKCRYYPSCSEYAIDAIDDRGVLMGLIKAGARILRCNPLFPGGYDPYQVKPRLTEQSARKTQAEL